MNMKDEDGFEPTSESTHLSLPTRYELANGFTSIPSRLLGDLEEKHLPQTFSIATRVAHDGIRIAVTSVRIALSNLKVQHLKDLLESRRSWLPKDHFAFIDTLSIHRLDTPMTIILR